MQQGGEEGNCNHTHSYLAKSEASFERSIQKQGWSLLPIIKSTIGLSLFWWCSDYSQAHHQMCNDVIWISKPSLLEDSNHNIEQVSKKSKDLEEALSNNFAVLIWHIRHDDMILGVLHIILPAFSCFKSQKESPSFGCKRSWWWLLPRFKQSLWGQSCTSYHRWIYKKGFNLGPWKKRTGLQKFLPLDLRPKKTRAIRRRLTKHQVPFRFTKDFQESDCLFDNK